MATYQSLHNALTRLPSMTNRQVTEVIPTPWAKERDVPLKAAS